MLDLWLIRHGEAEPRSAPWNDDAERPLTQVGRAQAARLPRILPPLDRLFTSPLTRAADTANAITHLAPRRAESLAVLGEEDAMDVIDAVRRQLEGAHSDAGSGAVAGLRPLRIALVGHQPTLGEVAGYLIAPYRADQPAAIALGKGGVVHLTGDRLEPGGMVLRKLLRAEDLDQMGS